MDKFCKIYIIFSITLTHLFFLGKKNYTSNFFFKFTAFPTLPDESAIYRFMEAVRSVRKRNEIPATYV